MHLHKKIRPFFLLLCLPFAAAAQQKTEVHGHRGFRGHFPENTVTAFTEAAKAGVDAVEMDVVISADSQVVVSHEPWFNPAICSEPDGRPVSKGNKHNFYKMTYAGIRQYDCGKRGNKKFPEQSPIPEHKPLLSEVIEQTEAYCKAHHLPLIQYNIEIKCERKGDNVWHPEPAVMVRLLDAVLKKYNIDERIMIQSFDIRSLQIMHSLHPALRIGLLTVGLRSVHHNIKALGFTPYMYNPNSYFASRHTIRKAHRYGTKVIVWTVDKPRKMRQLLRRGADGLITDYPDVAVKLRESLKSAQTSSATN